MGICFQVFAITNSTDKIIGVRVEEFFKGLSQRSRIAGLLGMHVSL